MLINLLKVFSVAISSDVNELKPKTFSRCSLITSWHEPINQILCVFESFSSNSFQVIFPTFPKQKKTKIGKLWEIFSNNRA